MSIPNVILITQDIQVQPEMGTGNCHAACIQRAGSTCRALDAHHPGDGLPCVPLYREIIHWERVSPQPVLSHIMTAVFPR